MTQGQERTQVAVAVALFVAGAFLYLPSGYLLRYAQIDLLPRPAFALVAVPVAVVLAFAHEAVVRGFGYRSLRGAVPPGAAAPLIALAGIFVPVAVRLFLFPVERVPLPVVIGHVILVEYPLSLGLTWLALATSSTRPGSVALASLWVLRCSLGVTFHGSPVPLLEIGSAIAAAAAIALTLAGPLTPHREKVLGAA
jgi:hypothetical protein